MTIPRALTQYQVFPKTPKTMFAGVPHAETLFLAFPDEQTAIAALTEAGLCKPGAERGAPPQFDGSVDFIGAGQQETAESRQSRDATVKVHAGVLVNVAGLIEPEAKA